MLNRECEYTWSGQRLPTFWYQILANHNDTIVLFGYFKGLNILVYAAYLMGSEGH